MPKFIRYRFMLLGALILASILISVSSVRNLLPQSWRNVWPGKGIRLGLDLQGGMYLILKVNLPKAVDNQLNAAVSDLKTALQRSQTALTTESVGFNRVGLRVENLAAADALRRTLAADFPNLQVISSSEQPQSLHVDVGLAARQVQYIQKNAVAQSLEVIRNRIDQFGVVAPVILQRGSDEIVVELPGIKEPERALALIGRTAQLEFKLVDAAAEVDLSALIAAALRSGRLQEGYNHEQLNRALKGEIPPEDEAYIERRVNRDTGEVSLVPMLLRKRTVMTGAALQTAQMEIGGNFNEPYVSLTFNSRGAQLFYSITQENVGRQLAIILDGVVQSAPVIREPISGGRAQITGQFSAAEASDLAIALRAGALPAPVDIVENLTIGPSLGQDSIHKGIAATLLGMILVVAFMALYYRISGVIANMALLLNLLLMLAALSLFGATLTLPGIAGVVLSIGMAVDSNVLIFERMREEFALQKPLWSAVDGGYHKAFWTIVDSHVTTLITAFALFLFGTGPIKGFAVTLIIGVVFNLFTALFGTRAVYDFLRFKRRIHAIRFLHILRNPRIDFIGLRHGAFLISGILVALGCLAFIQIERGHANLGVDFTGGTAVQFKAAQSFQLADIRTALARAQLGDYELQEVPSGNILIVHVKKSAQTAGQVADRVAGILAKELPQNRFTMQSKSEIGASVSSALRKAALIAIAISLAGIIVYLGWRFDLRFGVAAAIATFHDVLTVLGIFYLLNKEITLLVVTALLTLAGYSLTDTVVVYDRIRENMAHKSKEDTPAALINRSINEVLSRTIITSGTVFMVLIALLTMGGLILHDFALALTIGVVVGTYSSIFVASPIVYIWPARQKAGPSARRGRT